MCPAGKSLDRKGRANLTKDNVFEHFRGAKRNCLPSALRAPCLRTPATTTVRNVTFFRGRVEPDTVQPRETRTMRMKTRIDSPAGREQYGRRFATVEPVFANLRHNKRLDRFTLRGRVKVHAQWQRLCLVHNIEKLANAGYAAEAGRGAAREARNTRRWRALSRWDRRLRVRTSWGGDHCRRVGLPHD